MPPQKSNPLVLFQSISPQQQFKGISVQIRSDGSWSVFWDQYEAGSPESIPKRLQKIEDVVELLKAIETNQRCPGIVEEKYRVLVGYTLPHATVERDPFLIRCNECKWLIYKVIRCVSQFKVERGRSDVPNVQFTEVP